jgi:hypothetical protein
METALISVCTALQAMATGGCFARQPNDRTFGQSAVHGSFG